MSLKFISRLKARLLEYLLSSSVKQEIVLRSKEYQEMLEAYDGLEKELRSMSEKYTKLETRSNRISDDQGRLILEYCKLREELFQEREKTQAIINHTSGSYQKTIIVSSDGVNVKPL